ncbi:TonB-dependent receptor [Hanamia caeni]|jgi:TonB-linked SusC/RagA family outer membrane protein|uniref:TonB-dependent receptor n=1 Tax=Hanamia caeni TaxID=2294116 RepID=A0A3M9NC29_9BACT|nr:TonB-dependent receptor [Hanamia caeni]RNI35324.1 TonB-dependent receptor [Hanamia caeni]
MKSKFFALFILIFSFAIVKAQNKTVTGKVTSDAGEALSGATVSLKGTQKATTTNSSGEYSISVSPTGKEILIFSFVGKDPKEISVGERNIINVSLTNSTSTLNDVVVIGYGTVKRKDLTGAVSSVSGKEIAAVPVTNTAQALAGKLPGVSVTSQDGRPDADISIRVRGGGSVSQSNEPLYVVDGFPVSNINDIPAQQIESIDVLKDAASTAIYGARGANGVIIITTKSGKAGKMKIAYDGYVQFNEPTKYLPTMNAYNYIAYNWAYAQAISDSYADAWAMLWGIGKYAETYNNTDGINHYKNVAAASFSKQAYGSSFSHNHNISMGGGNANTKYLISGSYADNDGMKINSWFKRANASFKLSQKISKSLNFSFDTRFTDIHSMDNESTTNGKGSILSSAYQFRPIATKDVLGELDDSKNTQLGLYDYVLQDMYNPVALMKDYFPLSSQRSLRSNGSLSWNVASGLTLKTEFGYNTYWNRGKTWSGATYNGYLDKDGNKTYSGNASISSTEGWGLRWVNTLNYNVQGLNVDHDINFVMGQEVDNSHSEGISMYGNKYPVSFSSDRAFAQMDQYLMSTTINSGFSSNVGTPNRLNSYFGRINYSYLGRYLITGTFRADGSSRFAPSHRWGYFPAGAVAWRMSDEAFLKDVSWLNNLKIRVSYGEVGNDGISANLWKTQWSSDGLTGYSINEVQQSAYSPASTIANPDLKWETTITENVGVDFSLFSNRLFGTIDVYKNRTKDLLLLTSISAISGFSSTYDNVGSTSNRGAEISLGGDIVRNKNFTLSANFNVSFNKGRVDELAPGVNGLYKSQWGSTMTQPNTGDYILQVGKPVGMVRGYTYDGWYRVDDFDYTDGIYTLKKGVPDIASGIIGTVYGTNAHKPGGQSAYPGVIKFKDLNGDGVIDENDVSIIGNMTPKNTGGLNINSTFKNFDMALNFNWSYGNQVYDANYLAAFYGSKEDGLYRNRLNYLSGAYRIYDIKDGQLESVADPAKLKALNANATTFLPYHENPVVSTLGIQDGSFLRLNTVTLGYSLPESLIQHLKISRLRIYGAIYNALIWTNYPGLDPEVNTNTSQGNAQYPTIGLDWGSYPRARSYTIGLNVEF